MRLLAIGLALTLGGCASWHGPLDVVTPDELTLGQGRSSATMTGGVDTWWEGDDWPIETEGESEATYVALSWDIPTWQGHEDGMSRETQRNLALLIDQMVQEEVEDANDDSDSLLTLAEGAKAPPTWLPLALIGTAAVIVLGFALRSRRREEW